MFSGIVEGQALIKEYVSSPQSARLCIDVPFDGTRVSVGDSIAVHGVCLTVVNQTGQNISFDIASETLRRTTLGRISVGERLHVERALKVGDGLHGHFVTGHVDGVGAVQSLEWEGQTLRVQIELPNGLESLIVPKGAVALDGVSLTVGEVSQEWFSVYIVPHTQAVTRFDELTESQLINIEADILARYVQGALRRDSGVLRWGHAEPL